MGQGFEGDSGLPDLDLGWGIRTAECVAGVGQEMVEKLELEVV